MADSNFEPGVEGSDLTLTRWQIDSLIHDRPRNDLRLARACPILLGVALLALNPSGSAAQEGSWILGKKPERPGIVVLVLALHPLHLIEDNNFRVVTRTSGFALQYSHWFVGTGINTFGDRSFIAAIERHWVTADWGAVDFGLGYRVGLITGYDERLFSLAGKTPVLPLVGPVAWTHLGPIGVKLFYVYRAASLEGWVRF
jgi:hypothetical protein